MATNFKDIISDISPALAKLRRFTFKEVWQIREEWIDSLSSSLSP
jgi:hypothetical protein